MQLHNYLPNIHEMYKQEKEVNHNKYKGKGNNY